METNKILHADILDIIFDGKNKQYGAYELRKTYSRRLAKALLITAVVASMVFLVTLFANAFTSKKNASLNVRDTELAKIREEKIAPPPVAPPPKMTPPPKLNQVRFTPPVIVKDDMVKPDETIEEVKDDQVISTQTVVSDNKDAVVAPPVEDKGTQIVEVPQKKAADEDEIFTRVENEAEFPGGDGAWRRYLEKRLNGDTPVENGASEGTYTVTVKFVVSKEGNISDVVALTNHGFGMEAEAIKVIKDGPNWKPALQNGKNVNAYRTQPITFVVQ